MSKLLYVFVLCGMQRINHFAGMQQICRKGDLAKTLSRMARLFPHDYSFHPKTWVRHIYACSIQMSGLGMRRIDGYSRSYKDARTYHTTSHFCAYVSGAAGGVCRVQGAAGGTGRLVLLPHRQAHRSSRGREGVRDDSHSEIFETNQKYL